MMSMENPVTTSVQNFQIQKQKASFMQSTEQLAGAGPSFVLKSCSTSVYFMYTDSGKEANLGCAREQVPLAIRSTK